MEMPKFYAAKPCTIPPKAMGVWQIPSQKVIIPVYHYTVNRYNSQTIVDAENSACMQPYCNANVIHDHAGSVSNNGEGIWRMNKVKVDDEAYFVKPDGTYLYKCYQVAKVDHRGSYYAINGRMVQPFSSRDILCDSCVDSTGKKVYMAFFQFERKI